MRPALPVIFLALLSLLGFRPAVAQGGMAVEGTSFRITAPDGRVLRSPQLAGAVLAVELAGVPLRVRIDAVRRDPAFRGAAVWLHRFSVQQADGRWKHLCEPDAQGRREAFPLAGAIRANGTLAPADDGRFEIACSAGALAKCLRFGYLPWGFAPDGTPLRAAHDACVLMLRADYAGAGRPATREGTSIDISDRWGIRPRRPAGRRLPFEAGWNAQGAVCVHHVRIRPLATLAGVKAASPVLRGKTGAGCTRALALEQGALLFNGSRP